MVKLTPELINSSMQYMNPCRDRELDLRGKSFRMFFWQFEEVKGYVVWMMLYHFHKFASILFIKQKW